MPRYGTGTFSVYGKLLAVPQVEQVGQGDYRYVLMDLEVTTRHQQRDKKPIDIDFASMSSLL